MPGRRLRHRAILATATCALTAALFAGCSPDPSVGVDGSDGLVTLASEAGVDATFERIRDAIDANPNLTVLATVDHAANAERVGLDLPPTRLILFGNPRLGTPLMRAARTIAIDLPQKVLVWEDDHGVHVTWNDPPYLARRHGVTGHDDTLDTIAGALRSLGTTATSGSGADADAGGRP